MTRSASVALAALAAIGIIAHLLLRYALGVNAAPAALPLQGVLLLGGVPLVLRLARSAWRGQFGADHLAGVSIVASALLGEYLAGALGVLMLSGGEALEAYAVAEATSVLRALAGACRRSRTGREVVRGRGGRALRVGDRSRSCRTRPVLWMARSSRGAAAWTSRT
jgi:cation transport ATPase